MNDQIPVLALLHQLTDMAGNLDTHLTVILELPSHMQTVSITPMKPGVCIETKVWGNLSLKFDELVAESERCNTPLTARMSSTVGDNTNDSGIITAYYPELKELP